MTYHVSHNQKIPEGHKDPFKGFANFVMMRVIRRPLAGPTPVHWLRPFPPCDGLASK